MMLPFSSLGKTQSTQGNALVEFDVVADFRSFTNNDASSVVMKKFLRFLLQDECQCLLRVHVRYYAGIMGTPRS
jgi:hypothetical protein